jgi:hypothetical protein
MNPFRAIFYLEARRMLCRRNVIIFVVMALMLMLFLWDGIGNYRSILEDKEVFQQTERQKVGKYVLITQYGAYGIRLMFIPSPMSILFNNSSVFSELMANVDTGERLNIYNSFKGKNLFTEKSGGYMDFSGIFVIFGGLLALLYGYDSTRNKSYIKFFTNFAYLKRIYLFVFFSRLILLNFFFLLLAALSLIFVLAFGINLFNIHYVYFNIALLCLVSFFYSFGMMVGVLKSRTKFGFLIIGYMGFIFITPWMVNKIVYIRANDIMSNYKLEFSKLKAIMDFERRFYKKVGVFKSQNIAPGVVKDLIKKVLDNEYEKFEVNENEMKGEIMNNSLFHQRISSFLPTTLYISNNSELGSKGYLSFFEYYSFVQERKSQFINFYVEKKFFKENGKDKIESFIKSNENLFRARSSKSEYFKPGILFTLLYITSLCILNYLMLRKTIYRDRKKCYPMSDSMKITFKAGEQLGIKTDDMVIHKFYKTFSFNSKTIADKISFAGGNPSKNGTYDFVYLGNPGFLPGEITLAALIAFFKLMLNLTGFRAPPHKEKRVRGRVSTFDISLKGHS